jgi:hypothetical protein
MANQAWLDEVRARLANYALPPAYIRRFMDELSDHLQDITEENMSTEANAISRLGEPKQVAESAATIYRRRSFIGRHPTAAFLVFGVSPVVSLAALFVIAYVVVLAISEVCELLGVNIQHFFADMRRFEPSASVVLPYLVSLLTVVIPCIFASILYCRLARRLGLGKKWMLLSCVILAVIATIPYCSVNLSGISGESGLRWGVWNPDSIMRLPYFIVWVVCQPRQLMQLFVPLVIGWWIVRRKHDKIRLQSAL